MRLFPNRTLPAGDPSPFVLFKWMDITGPSTDTAKHNELYLRRLYVLRTPWFGYMIHWIAREDWDRDALHDHPWTFFRYILKGGYTESVAWAVSDTDLSTPIDLEHRACTFSKFPDGAFHRITSVKPGTVSIVFTGPKRNAWGFFVPGKGKVGWRDYVSPGGGAR